MKNKNRYIILLPNIISDLEENYNIKVSSLDSIRENFLQYNNGLLFDEYRNGYIELYGQEYNFLCTYAEEESSLKAVKIMNKNLNRYMFAIEKSNLLLGNWEFINLDQANRIDENSTLEQEFLVEELKRYRKRRYDTYDIKGYEEFEKYWKTFQDISDIEESISLENKKNSHTKFKSMTINYKNLIINYNLINLSYDFKIGDHISLKGFGFIGECIKLNNNFMQVQSNIEIIKRFHKYQKNKEVEKEIFCENIGELVKIKREQDALKALFNRDSVNPNLRDFIPSVEKLSKNQNSLVEIDYSLLGEDFNNYFSDKQRQAVLGAIRTEDLYLIQGPPGTGKTTVINQIIEYLLQKKFKVLVCSETNLAVDNILNKLGSKSYINPIRIASEDKVELGNEKYLLENRAEETIKEIENNLICNKEYISDLEKNFSKYTREYNLHNYILVNLDKYIQEYSLYTTLDRELKDISNEIYIKKTSLNGNRGYIDKVNCKLDLESNLGIYEDLLSLDKKLKFSYLKIKEVLNFNNKVHKRDKVKIFNYITKLEDIYLEVESLEKIEKIYLRKEEEIRKLKDNNQNLEKEIEKLFQRSLEKNTNLEDIIQIEKDILNLKSKILLNSNNIKQNKGELITLKSDLEKKLKNITKLKDLLIYQKEKLLEILEEYKLTRDVDLKEDLNLKDLIDIYKDYEKIVSTYKKPIDTLKLYKYLNLYKQYKEKDYSNNILEKEIDSLKKKRLKVKDKLQAIETSLKSKTDRFNEYFNLYNLNISKLKLNEEINRCNKFIKKYKTDLELLKVFNSNKDLAKAWLDRLKYNTEIIEDIYLDISNLICSTCSSIASTTNNHFFDAEFDYVVIDEAARSTSKELLIPMIRGKKIILVGDHKQISPKLEKEIEKRMEELEDYNEEDLELYSKSLFEIMYEKINKDYKTFLDTQFRMNHCIGSLVSNEFYNGELKNGPASLKDIYKTYGFRSPIKWCDTGSNKESREIKKGTSYINKLEGKKILNILDYIDRQITEKKSLGIISPYRAQIEYLNKIVNNTYENLDIEINTIDGFQGREKDIIIFSLVRNNSKGIFGHTCQESRLNVAMSRAKDLLIIVGGKEFVKINRSKSGKLYNILKTIDQN